MPAWYYSIVIRYPPTIIVHLTCSPCLTDHTLYIVSLSLALVSIRCTFPCSDIKRLGNIMLRLLTCFNWEPNNNVYKHVTWWQLWSFWSILGTYYQWRKHLDIYKATDSFGVNKVDIIVKHGLQAFKTASLEYADPLSDALFDSTSFRHSNSQCEHAVCLQVFKTASLEDRSVW